MNGSSNNLLFELILLGKFEYINEPLFFYSGKNFKGPVLEKNTN